MAGQDGGREWIIELTGKKIITKKIISNEPHNHLNSKINKRRTILKSYNLDQYYVAFTSE